MSNVIYRVYTQYAGKDEITGEYKNTGKTVEWTSEWLNDCENWAQHAYEKMYKEVFIVRHENHDTVDQTQTIIKKFIQDGEIVTDCNEKLSNQEWTEWLNQKLDPSLYSFEATQQNIYYNGMIDYKELLEDLFNETYDALDTHDFDCIRDTLNTLEDRFNGIETAIMNKLNEINSNKKD